jgi:hypothetical protein
MSTNFLGGQADNLTLRAFLCGFAPLPALILYEK